MKKMIAIDIKYKVDSISFFIPNKSKMDADFEITEKKFLKLFQETENHQEIGFHPGYDTFRDSKEFAKQKNKLEKSGLLEVFKSENIFISEKMKFKKPDKQFFDIIEKSISNTQKIVMIGDDPVNDILGAKQNNWETIWLKLNRKLKVSANFEIQNINELESLLQVNK